MKKFKFRLEKVKNTKEKQVKQKTYELAELHRKLEREKKRLTDFQTNLNRTQKELSSKTSKGCSVRTILEYQQYISQLNQTVFNEKKKIEDTEEQIENLQAVLLNLNKEKKMLNKLKEKRYIQYLQEQNREEQKLLDDTFNLTQQFRNLL